MRYLALLFLLAGCASEPAAGPSIRPSFDSTPSPVRYESAQAVVDALGERGVTCVFDHLGPGKAEGLTDFGLCDTDWGRLDIYVYEGNAYDHLTDQYISVEGANWVLVAPEKVEVAMIGRDALGGELHLGGAIEKENAES